MKKFHNKNDNRKSTIKNFKFDNRLKKNNKTQYHYDDTTVERADRSIKQASAKFLFAGLLISIIVFLLFIFTQNKPKLQSYNETDSNSNVYTLIEISDEEFLNKVKFAKEEEIVQMLKMGANPNAVDPKGRNALSIAAIFNPKPAVAKALVKGGVKVNSVDSNGYTPLMLSSIASGNSYDFSKELINLGANVNMKTLSGITTLSIAVSSNTSEKLIELLITNGANVNEKNSDKSTPIIIASRITTNPNIIAILLKNSARADKKFNNGRSAYSFALNNKAISSNNTILEKLKNLQ